MAYLTVYAVGMLLFMITLAMNLVGNRILRHFQEVYE
jgi:ABC-type phosphate transport system permease subunit